MKDATHFIEVYSNKDQFKKFGNNSTNTKYLPLSYLDQHLEKTLECLSLQTIAIFKIKKREEK
jgi:hypothetical protein